MRKDRHRVCVHRALRHRPWVEPLQIVLGQRGGGDAGEDDHVAEAVVYTKGPNIVARESATTYEAAVDQLVDKLERQIERYRDKRVLEPRRAVQLKRDALPGEEAA